jgi:sensor domain CHASE-containing protein
MDMNTAEQILVITLAAFLALFLLLGIILITKVIQLMNRLKEIADKAKEVAENVESASEMLRKSAGPIAIGRFFMNIADVVIKHKGRK